MEDTLTGLIVFQNTLNVRGAQRELQWTDQEETLHFDVLYLLEQR